MIFGSKGKLAATTEKCLPGLYDRPVIAQQKKHITGKPVVLIEDLMQIVKLGSVVLDPFIGSGTTALAAIKTGRKGIGMELSEEYFAISVERLSEQLTSIV